MKKLIVSVIIAAFAATSFAQSVWKAQDGECPLIIRYVGEQTSPYYEVTANIFRLGEPIGGTNGETHVSMTNKLSDIVAAINSATGYGSTTNAYVRPWEAKVWAGIGTEVMVSNIVAVSSNAVTAREWSKGLKWDTSACLHYDAVVSGIIDDGVQGGLYITDIFGDIGGTGNCTVYVYEGATVKYQKAFNAVISSYASGLSTDVVTYTATTTQGNIPDSGISFGSGIYIGQGRVGFVRASMSTTATTGGLGVNTKMK